jgi:hypothetical protein
MARFQAMKNSISGRRSIRGPDVQMESFRRSISLSCASDHPKAAKARDKEKWQPVFRLIMRQFVNWVAASRVAMNFSVQCFRARCVMVHRPALTALPLVALLTAISPAWAAEPVAIVEEAPERTGVVFMDYLDAGFAFELAPNERLVVN